MEIFKKVIEIMIAISGIGLFSMALITTLALLKSVFKSKELIPIIVSSLLLIILITVGLFIVYLFMVR